MAFQPVILDSHDITITPVFRHESIEDINASEREGTLQKKILTVVEVRFAGTDRYQPVFPADAHWQFQRGRSVTYAERWADQYRDFCAGVDQRASGTPLEMLRPFGISDSQLSLCRALKIYSIEALDAVQGDAANGLQMARNVLKEMAKKFLDARANREAPAAEVQSLRDEIEALKLLLAKNDGGQTVVTEVVPEMSELEALQEEVNNEAAANDKFSEWTDDQLRAHIEAKTGAKPHHRLSRASLLEAVREVAA